MYILSWLNIIKMAIALDLLIYRFNIIPIKIPPTFLAEIGRLIQKFIWRWKGPRTGKTMLNNNKVGRLTLPDLKTYFWATVMKTVWDWHMDRHPDQQNRIESSEINLYSQVVFDKVAKIIQWENSNLQQMVLGKLDSTHVREWGWTLNSHGI